VPGPRLRVVILRPQVRQFMQHGFWVRITELDGLLYVVRDPHIALSVEPVVVQLDK